MLFKKKKKEEAAEEEVVNPFEEMEAQEKKETKLDTTLINEVEYNEPTYTNVVNPAIISENMPIINNDIDSKIDEEILNEVHPAVLEESDTNSDEMDFKNMDVDDLIQDVVKAVYCPNCGSRISENTELCSLCGAAIK